MTALELADKLKLFWHTENDNLFEQAETMLRQQQAEIEALKERLEETRKLYIKQLALQRLSDISQAIEQKPVAWMSNGKEFYVQQNYCPNFIPLYTYPIRELTDDKLLIIYKKCLNLKNEFKDNEKRTSYFNFAKAVLKKANENEL